MPRGPLRETNPEAYAILRRVRIRALYLAALESTLQAPDLPETSRKFFTAVREQLYADRMRFPSRHMIRLMTRYGRFICHCGRPATRVYGLKGRCADHERELFNKVKVSTATYDRIRAGQELVRKSVEKRMRSTDKLNQWHASNNKRKG